MPTKETFAQLQYYCRISITQVDACRFDLFKLVAVKLIAKCSAQDTRFNDIERERGDNHQSTNRNALL